MKKNKLLLPIAIVVSTAGIVIPLASCSCSKVETEDTKNVKKINEVLETTKPTTMSEVVADLKEKEIDIETLSPLTSGNQYVWDSKANKMFIMDAEGKAAVAPDGYKINEHKYNLWKMVKSNSTNSSQFILNNKLNSKIDTFDSNSPYSQYLRSGETFPTEIQFSSGIDTGQHIGKELTLKTNSSVSNGDITIYTNGATSLTINSNSYTVINHYGSLLDLTVESVPNTGSFTVNEKICGNVILQSGSFIASATSDINTIIVESDSVSITLEQGELISATVGTVAKTANVTKSVTEIIENYEEIEEEVKPTIPDQPIPDPSTQELSGLGTKESPYIVSSKEEIAKISTSAYTNKFNYFRFENTNKEIDGSDWEYNGTYGLLNGFFDGNGLIINNLNRPLFEEIGPEGEHASAEKPYGVSNITLNCNICMTGSTAAVCKYTNDYLLLENVEVHGSITGAVFTAGLVGFGPEGEEQHWILNDCHCDATITATSGYASGLIGYTMCNTATSDFQFNDTWFDGRLISTVDYETGKNNYSYFESSCQNASTKIKTTYSEAFTTLHGEIEGNYYAAPAEKDNGYFWVGVTPPTGKENCNINDGYTRPEYRTKITSQTLETTEKGEVISVPKHTNATSASAALFVGPNKKGVESGNYVKSFIFDNTLTIVGDNFKTNNVRNYNIFINAEGHKEGVTIDGTNLYIGDNDTFYGTTYASAYILIVEYDTNGLPLVIYQMNLPH